MRKRDEAIAELRAEVAVLRGRKDGTWKANKHYAIGDVCTWNARSWRCLTAHRSHDPATDRAYWERV